MKLWKKAAGLIKDRNSIWAASISRRTSYRNPDLESIVIKATSHDELHVDYKNFHRVYQWVRTSPMYVKPLLYAISSRMEKTKDWVVALKGLMLMHGVFCCKIPAVQRIGRLPFDLSNFTDGHSKPSRTWAYDAFVRAYFTYLDQRSAFLQESATSAVAFKKQQQEQLGRLQGGGLHLEPAEEEPPLTEEIVKLRKWQALMDMLLEIRPNLGTAKVYLVFEAMICILTEVFDVYSRICKGIARLLMRIYAAPGKEEAKMALAVVQKAVMQGQELEMYLEFCRDMGALGSLECPKVKHIPEEDIEDLERIIREAGDDAVKENREENSKAIVEQERGGDGGGDLLIVVDDDHYEQRTKKKVFKTIITDKWEVFPEDDFISWVSTGYNDGSAASADYNNPFASSSNLMPHVAPAQTKPVLPDLISL